MAIRVTENFPTIPGLPGGWNPVLFGQSQREPRQAVVVCQRESLPGDRRPEWVCWRVNMVEGGCHIGHYKSSADEAVGVFNERFRALELQDSEVRAGRA